MIVEESRLQALTSLYGTTKDMFLQTNSHRLLCLVFLVSSLVLLSILFFQASGLVQSMISLAAVMVSFTLLVSELYLSRRLSLTRSVLINIEKELSGHITEYLGQASRLNNRNSHRDNGNNRTNNPIGVGESTSPGTNLWPLSLMSGKIKGSSLVSSDSRNWIIFIHGLAAFAVMIPLGTQILRLAEIDFFSSALTLAFLTGLMAFSILFVYVVASERKLEVLILGSSKDQAKDESRKMVWRSLGAVMAVVGPFCCYAALNSNTANMVERVWEVVRGAGSEGGFWAPVVLAGGVFMMLISLLWRSVGPKEPAENSEGDTHPE